MRKIVLLAGLLFTACHALNAQALKYDIFTGSAPAGFIQKEKGKRLLYEKRDGNTFCQIHVWPAQKGSSDPDANFSTDWNYFGVQQYGIKEAPEKEKVKHNGWDVVTGGGQSTMNGIPFIVTVSTFTQQDISWCVLTLLNDEKYTNAVDAFLLTLKTDISKFKRPSGPVNNPAAPNANPAAIMPGISKYTTNFDDGWQATPLTDYVRVIKGNTEIRLLYIDSKLDDARPNTIDAPEYYWSKYVTPYFNVAQPQKWSGVEYPVIYFMEGNAVNRQTGKSCYVALKIVYEGGARPILAISSDAASYRQQFPHPNDLNRMQAYNKFAVTAKDVIGQWNKSGGGGVEYYNAYTGTYAGMSALSTTDEFTFSGNGSYNSVHNSANTNSGGTQFAALKYNGKFSTTDWELLASNRVSGKTKKFLAQFIAVKNGYLLQLTDSDYLPLVYTLFKVK
jgi:hypothetical protein